MHGIDFTGIYRKGNFDSAETETEESFEVAVNFTFLRDITVSIELNIDRNSSTIFTGNYRIEDSTDFKGHIDMNFVQAITDAITSDEFAGYYRKSNNTINPNKVVGSHLTDNDDINANDTKTTKSGNVAGNCRIENALQETELDKSKKKQ